MLVKDVYKLGRAGDIKKVADGYGRNFLISQGFAVLATPGAVKQAERIRKQAEVRRAAENSELQGLADQIKDVVLTFAAKAGETGKLYGSITTQDVATAVTEQVRFEIKKQQVDMQPVRNLGEFTAQIRLTMDLVPEVKILVHREGEAYEEQTEEAAEEVTEEAKADAVVVEETAAEEPAETGAEAEADDETPEA
ncbi:MAG TPA: 50S ribosomal protein L9 [Anaerolineales bacterium]|nr:50S ribosomal protein L9 [Anaerolineales bacterium]